MCCLLDRCSILTYVIVLVQYYFCYILAPKHVMNIESSVTTHLYFPYTLWLNCKFCCWVVKNVTPVIGEEVLYVTITINFSKTCVCVCECMLEIQP
jgi:hypothetical protein